MGLPLRRPAPIHKQLSLDISDIVGREDWEAFVVAIQKFPEYVAVDLSNKGSTDFRVDYVGRDTDWAPLKRLLYEIETHGFQTDPAEEDLPQEQVELLEVVVQEFTP